MILLTGYNGSLGSRIAMRLGEGFDTISGNLRFNTSINTYNTIIHCAARVGGIKSNIEEAEHYLLENTQINNNIFSIPTKRFIFIGSSCVYPKGCHQPMHESMVWSGPLEDTVRGYAMAKLQGMTYCQIYRQKGMDYYTITPTNMYGGNYHGGRAHVIDDLIYKFTMAKYCMEGNRYKMKEYSKLQDDPLLDNHIFNLGIKPKALLLRGGGKIYRDFIHVDDVADAVMFCYENVRTWDLPFGHVNVGSSGEIKISLLAEMICDLIGYKGDIIWMGGEDGMEHKMVDTRLMESLGWKPKINFEEGLYNLIQQRNG